MLLALALRSLGLFGYSDSSIWYFVAFYLFAVFHDVFIQLLPFRSKLQKIRAVLSTLLIAATIPAGVLAGTYHSDSRFVGILIAILIASYFAFLVLKTKQNQDTQSAADTF